MFSRFFIYRPIFAAVVSIVIVLIGLVSMMALPVARYPEIAPPTIVVTANYPGATAETIAETVATPIEQQVNGVEGMLYMTSTSSSDGTMSLKVTFAVGTDLDMANVLTQNRVALAEPKLPEEVRRLGVTVKKRSSDILYLIALYSPDRRYDESFLTNYANLRIRDELARVPGVGEVTLFSSEYAMRIWLDPDKMRAREVTTNDVVAAIREQNVQVASGSVGEPPTTSQVQFQLTVNTMGRLREIEQFENIVIRSGEGGRLLRVKDVARVELGARSYNMRSFLNGQTAAIMSVYQLPGANAVEVADAVSARLVELQRQFPEGMTYSIAYDFTDVIRASLREVVITLFITMVLVILTVYIFLQDWRATLIPAVTIPVSLIGTFIVLAALGYSLNILTLFGLVLVIGIVVDDAIVVVENTSRLIGEGLSGKEAAVKSMMQVSGPVVATTLVLLAVFVPTLFLGGISGRLFRQFAVTISVATVFSSVNALTLSPALCGILLRPPKGKPLPPLRLFNAALNWMMAGYLGTVRWALRGAVVGLVIFAALVVGAIYGMQSLPRGFVPLEDEGQILISAQLPDGAAMDRTLAVVDRIDEILVDSPGIQSVVSIAGFSVIDESRASNAATIFVTLVPWSERGDEELSQFAIVQRMNRQLGAIQEAQVVAFTKPPLPGLGTSGGFVMQLQDRAGAGLGMLESVAQEMAGDANQQAGLTGVFTTFRANVPQIFLDIDREQVKAMGLPLQNVFDALAAYMGSVYINDFSMMGRIYQVKVQAEAPFRATADDIRRLEVRNPAGQMVPLGALMEVREELGPQTVTHFNIYPAARITGQPAPGYSSGDALTIMEEMAARKLPMSMGYEWTEISFEEKAAAGGSAAVFLFAIVVVYLVLAAQYESWSLPWTVVLAVPAALLGAVLGVMLRGFDFNVYTQIGIVLLIGLSAKTAILIVEFAKAQREAGRPVFDAALDAAGLRFRAVLMTAFSFILGVIPLLVATGAGAVSRQVLGTAVFFGMLVATAIGVIAVPMLYLVVQRLAESVGRMPKSLGEQVSAAPQATITPADTPSRGS
jgi:HAE1 family hydrophobic/amphiphilic exporter-1